MHKKTRSSLIPSHLVVPADANGMPLILGPMGRRSFVRTTGGILVAAGVGTACAGTDPSETGRVIVTITGLGTGLLDGGTMVVTRTDVTSQSPVSIVVPPSGSGEGDVPGGTYHVVYTPPPGYTVVGGNEFDVGVKANETTNVDVTVSFIVVATQGTLRVQVSGLTAAAANGGTASLQRTDIPGQAPVSAPIPLAGSVDTVVASGTYTVTFTPPTGFTVASPANPQTGVVVGANTTAAVAFAVTVSGGGGGSFTAGDITNNASFETGFDGFVSGGFATPTGVTRVTTQAKLGLTSIHKAMVQTTLDTNGDIHYPFYARDGQNGWVANPAGVDRLYSRFWLKVDKTFNGTILKLQMFQQTGFSKFAEFSFFQNYLAYSYTWEWGGGYVNIATLASLNDGNWHSIESDVQFNGNTDAGGDFPSTAIWYDGVDVSIAAPPIVGGTISGSFRPDLGKWLNGRLNAGSRHPNNSVGLKIGVWSGPNILNANNPVVGNLWVDNISISTKGRVGP